MTSTTTQTPWAECPHCGTTQVPYTPSIFKYFENEHLVCGVCTKKMDWWETMRRSLHKSYMPSMIYASIGAVQTCISITLQPNQYHGVILRNEGIPEDARVLEITFSQAPGGLKPIQIIRPSYSLPEGYPRHVEVFSLPLLEEAEETDAFMWVSWIENNINSDQRKYLVDAFEYFAESAYNLAIIPANVAVELTLNRLMNSFLSKYTSKKDVEQFLQDSATYGHQLNILLPVITSLCNLPVLSKNIKGGLNRLRKLRNDIAHRGATEIPISKDDISLCLSSAWIGYHYLEYLETRLNNREQST
jgi:hypothetical protein